MARSPRHLEGVLLSLRVWAAFEGLKTTFVDFGWSTADSFDAIVIATKENYDPRAVMDNEGVPGLPHDLRYAGIARDLPGVVAFSRRLKWYSGLLIVISNPVDLLASVISRIASSATVVGLGLGLDAERTRFFLCQDVGQWPLPTSEQLPLVGVHGPEAMPDRDSAHWRSCERAYGRERMERALVEGLKLGYRIVLDLGYTLQDCGVVFRDDIQWLLRKDPEAAPRCVAVARDGIAIGGPWRFDRKDPQLLSLLVGESVKEHTDKTRERLTLEVEALDRVLDLPAGRGQ